VSYDVSSDHVYRGKRRRRQSHEKDEEEKVERLHLLLVEAP